MRFQPCGPGAGQFQVPETMNHDTLRSTENRVAALRFEERPVACELDGSHDMVTVVNSDRHQTSVWSLDLDADTAVAHVDHVAGIANLICGAFIPAPRLKPATASSSGRPGSPLRKGANLNAASSVES